jgi:hypothetical protein
LLIQNCNILFYVLIIIHIDTHIHTYSRAPCKGDYQIPAGCTGATWSTQNATILFDILEGRPILSAAPHKASSFPPENTRANSDYLHLDTKDSESDKSYPESDIVDSDSCITSSFTFLSAAKSACGHVHARHVCLRSIQTSLRLGGTRSDVLTAAAALLITYGPYIYNAHIRNRDKHAHKFGGKQTHIHDTHDEQKQAHTQTALPQKVTTDTEGSMTARWETSPICAGAYMLVRLSHSDSRHLPAYHIMARAVRMYPPDYSHMDDYGHVDDDRPALAHILCLQRAATAMIQLAGNKKPVNEAWLRDEMNGAGKATLGHIEHTHNDHIACILTTLNDHGGTPNTVNVTLRSAALAYVGWRHYHLDNEKPVYFGLQLGLMTSAHHCVGGDLESQDFMLRRYV